MEILNILLKKKVTELTSNWGVEIEDVEIVDIDLGKKVNESLRDVPAAELRVKTRAADAIADSNYIEKQEPFFGIVELDNSDIRRSAVVEKIIKIYEKRN
jgi:hypothetical protein